MTTGKTIALARWTFVGKIMSLLLNMLSRLVITFLPRSKRLLISWLQSPFAVIWQASNLQCSTFFVVQLSHPYLTHGKTTALTIWTFVSKVISLLFNMLSRFIIAFLSRSKCLNFMAAVSICNDFGAQENKIYHCFYFLPIYLPWNDGSRCHDLSFLNVAL